MSLARNLPPSPSRYQNLRIPTAQVIPMHHHSSMPPYHLRTRHRVPNHTSSCTLIMTLYMSVQAEHYDVFILRINFRRHCRDHSRPASRSNFSTRGSKIGGGLLSAHFLVVPFLLLSFYSIPFYRPYFTPAPNHNTQILLANYIPYCRQPICENKLIAMSIFHTHNSIGALAHAKFDNKLSLSDIRGMIITDLG